jgi:hypothetical protein
MCLLEARCWHSGQSKHRAAGISHLGISKGSAEDQRGTAVGKVSQLLIGVEYAKAVVIANFLDRCC